MSFSFSNKPTARVSKPSAIIYGTSDMMRGFRLVVCGPDALHSPGRSEVKRSIVLDYLMNYRAKKTKHLSWWRINTSWRGISQPKVVSSCLHIYIYLSALRSISVGWQLEWVYLEQTAVSTVTPKECVSSPAFLIYWGPFTKCDAHYMKYENDADSIEFHL